MTRYEVLYIDIIAGCQDIMVVKASSTRAAIDQVERAGEYEVIEVTPEGQEL